MKDGAIFDEILEAANQLPVEDQETLIDILNRRIHDRHRTEILKDIKAAQKEFKKNQCRPVSPEELMKEILR